MNRESNALCSGSAVTCALLAMLVAGCSAAGVRVPEAFIAPPATRIVVVSLDGLGQEIWEEDPAAEELRALRRVAARGVTAGGLVQAFPSVTPSAHAALWTGAYGDVSGIVAAGNLLLPRAEHTPFERGSGFDSRHLRAEPLWVAAARQGVSVVGHQATQSYPFVPFVTAPDAPVAPVLVSGYGPPMLEPHRVHRRSEMVRGDLERWSDLEALSELPVLAFEFRLATMPIHAALVAQSGSARGYDAMYLEGGDDGARVRAAAAPLESTPPRDRPLARHYSEGLHLHAPPDGTPTVAYFRLFEVAPDGSDFLLHSASLHSVAIHDAPGAEADAERRLLREAGGFVGNGPSYLWRDGVLGAQLHAGGDGTAERRYLEGVELVLRQYNEHSRWLAVTYAPRLLLDYSNYPDEVDHWWYGLAHPATPQVSAAVRAGYQEFRRWAYAALDFRIALLDSIAGDDGIIVFTADHGMTPVWKEVHANVALRQAGLLNLDAAGEIDPARTKAVYHAYSVVLNTTDWRGGIVPEDRRGEVVAAVESALRRVRDPDTGEPVFTAFFQPETDGQRLGIGGEAGGDLYFDVAPGYHATARSRGDAVVERVRVPYGYHGHLPTRRDMLATFIARGLPVAAGSTMPALRAVDVAPLVAELLAIEPPADAVGSAPPF